MNKRVVIAVQMTTGLASVDAGLAVRREAR